MVAGAAGAHARLRLQLPLPPHARGVVRIERLRISSAHPFGLFRAWTWVHTPLELPGVPRARRPAAPAGAGRPAHRRARPAAAPTSMSGSGCAPFRDGDSPRQVDWKAYAREAPLLVKEYQPAGSELLLFDLAAGAGRRGRARLSQLARWIVDAEAAGTATA